MCFIFGQNGVLGRSRALLVPPFFLEPNQGDISELGGFLHPPVLITCLLQFVSGICFDNP